MQIHIRVERQRAACVMRQCVTAGSGKHCCSKELLLVTGAWGHTAYDQSLHWRVLKSLEVRPKTFQSQRLTHGIPVQFAVVVSDALICSTRVNGRCWQSGTHDLSSSQNTRINIICGAKKGAPWLSNGRARFLLPG